MLGYLFSAVKNAERDASLTIRARFNILDENELAFFPRRNRRKFTEHKLKVENRI